MPRTVYYAASSLDGFIATPDHSLAWLLHQDIDQHGPLGPAGFTQRVGAIAMGSATYEWIRSHLDGWEYTVPTWVFTRRHRVSADAADITFTDDDVRQVHAAMVRAAGDRDVWVMGGGDVAGQFADAGLLDEVAVAWAPVTLGAGIPLLPRRLELRLIDVDRNGAFACVRYDVVRPSDAGRDLTPS